MRGLWTRGLRHQHRFHGKNPGTADDDGHWSDRHRGFSALAVLMLHATVLNQHVHVAVVCQREAERDGSPGTAGHNVFRANVFCSLMYYLKQQRFQPNASIKVEGQQHQNTSYCNCCFRIRQMCVVSDVTGATYSGYSIVSYETRHQLSLPVG